MRFEDLDLGTQLYLYVKMSMQSLPYGIFCTCNPKLQAAGDQLISKNILIELKSPGGADRAFALTDFALTNPNIGHLVKLKNND